MRWSVHLERKIYDTLCLCFFHLCITQNYSKTVVIFEKFRLKAKFIYRGTEHVVHKKKCKPNLCDLRTLHSKRFIHISYLPDGHWKSGLSVYQMGFRNILFLQTLNNSQ